MFRLVHDSNNASTFIHAFDALLKTGAEQVSQWLSTPGGGFEAKVYYREDLDLWAYIDTEIYENRYSCWFGVGKPNWRPAIEINVPVSRTLHCYGQLAEDKDGELHLLHRGGLGGGKFTVKTAVFADLINGFLPDFIQDGDRSRAYFVLGRSSDPDMLNRLAAYVKEAARIRRLRENEVKYAAAVHAAGGSIINGQALGGELTAENTDSGQYRVNRIVAFQRIHGRIHKALVEELISRGEQVANKRLHGGIGPDLFTTRNDGSMASLYEIKVGVDSQSIFTAIGQLLVYSSETAHHVKKILVVKGMPRSKLFTSAIAKQNIEVVIYSISDDDAIAFKSLG